MAWPVGGIRGRVGGLVTMDGSRGLTRDIMAWKLHVVWLARCPGSGFWFGQLFGAEGVGDDWGRGEGGLILGVEFREAGGKVSIGFMVLGNGWGLLRVWGEESLMMMMAWWWDLASPVPRPFVGY